MDRKYLKQVFVYFLTTATAVFATFYILYHVFNTEMDKIDTTLAVMTQGSNTINTGGYVVRDETLLYTDYPGAAVLSLHPNGERVAVNTDVAKVYTGEKDLLKQIMEIENLITVLESSTFTGKSTSADVRNYDARIQNNLRDIIGSIQNGSLNISRHHTNSILSDINARKVAMKTVSDYNQALSTLKGERDRLVLQLDSAVQTISTPASGNVYLFVDGFEQLFDYSDIENLTLPTYRKLEEKQKNTVGSKGSAIGKVVTNTYWYLCCEVPGSYTRDLKKGNEYKVIFTDNANVEIIMKLDNIITEHGGDSSVLVLGTRTSPPGFDFTRYQNVRIVFGTTPGYKVPVEAVRSVDGATGVYILNGNTIKFRQIEILVEIDNHFIVKEQDRLNDEKYYEKLGLFDVIVVSGKELYLDKFIS